MPITGFNFPESLLHSSAPSSIATQFHLFPVLSLLPFSIIFDKCSGHVAVYVDNCVVQVDIEHNLPGHEKAVAPVADTKWALVEVKMAACPRQDPDEDPSRGWTSRTARHEHSDVRNPRRSVTWSQTARYSWRPSCPAPCWKTATNESWLPSQGQRGNSWQRLQSGIQRPP